MKQPYPIVTWGQHSIVFNFLSPMSTLVFDTVRGIQYSWWMKGNFEILFSICKKEVISFCEYSQSWFSSLSATNKSTLPIWGYVSDICPIVKLGLLLQMIFIKQQLSKGSVKTVEVPGKRCVTFCKVCFRKIKKCMYLHNRRSRHSS